MCVCVCATASASRAETPGPSGSQSPQDRWHRTTSRRNHRERPLRAAAEPSPPGGERRTRLRTAAHRMACILALHCNTPPAPPETPLPPQPHSPHIIPRTGPKEPFGKESRPVSLGFQSQRLTAEEVCVVGGGPEVKGAAAGSRKRAVARCARKGKKDLHSPKCLRCAGFAALRGGTRAAPDAPGATTRAF